MDYWLHRIFSHEPEMSVPLLERGILTIGFNEVSNQQTLAAERDALKKILEESYGWTDKKLGQKTGTLWRFLHEFKVGDFVVVPTLQAVAFGIFEVLEQAKPIDDLPPDKLQYLGVNLINGQGLTRIIDGKIFDLGFFIKVRAVTNYDSSPFVPCDDKFLFPILSGKGQLANAALNVL